MVVTPLLYLRYFSFLYIFCFKFDQELFSSITEFETIQMIQS